MKRHLLYKLSMVLPLMLLAVPFAALGEDGDACTDVVVLSTTDMHGKCWHTNQLTDTPEPNSMLSVSTAVRQFRETYGKAQVILIDNGDLFQGAPVSETQLLARISGARTDPLAMALCLKQIGYDAFVLGNHEFNYDWNVMSDTYRYLEQGGIPVLSANAVWDGTDGVHAAGENAFTPYITKTVTVNGHAHKIGILGLENTDITRWDLPNKYPGLRFSHPGNENYSMAQEASPYIARMRKEGCEFIIVSFHSGLGNDDAPLVFGANSENQGLRLISQTEGINLLILGHDHSSSYSNTCYPDAAGNDVLVVNGGGEELTQTAIRFREDDSGALVWQITDSRNLNLADYAADPVLEAEIAPYAALSDEMVSRPIGTAGGTWDGSQDYYTRQTDTISVINAAMIDIPSRYLEQRYADPAATGVDGLDHLDVDMSMGAVAVRNRYVIRAGALSMRDVYRVYRHANSVLVIPMRGSEIRAVMEENAAKRLNMRVLNGSAYFYNIGNDDTNIIFGGLNFTCDMSRPEGERIVAGCFANGRPFEADRVYLVAVNNYMLGNDLCGLRAFSADDAIWAQQKDAHIQDLIEAYIQQRCAAEGALRPDVINWRWSIEYSADPADLAPYAGAVAARLAPMPEDGHTYVLCQEAEEQTMTADTAFNSLGAVGCPAWGDALIAPLSPDALRFTVHLQKDGSMALVNADGRYLTGSANGNLSLTQQMAEGDLSLWALQPAYGGWNIVCVGTGGADGHPQALRFDTDSGCFNMFYVFDSGIFVMNFYEICNA